MLTYESGITMPLVFRRLRIQEKHIIIIAATTVMVVASISSQSEPHRHKGMWAMSDDADLARVSGIDTERTVR